MIYTDGVTDAKDPGGVLFGEERLLALLDEPSPSAAELLRRIGATLRSHRVGAAQFDDITMLAVTRKAASLQADKPD